MHEGTCRSFGTLPPGCLNIWAAPRAPHTSFDVWVRITRPLKLAVYVLIRDQNDPEAITAMPPATRIMCGTQAKAQAEIYHQTQDRGRHKPHASNNPVDDGSCGHFPLGRN